jgi:hypothetical protein
MIRITPALAKKIGILKKRHKFGARKTKVGGLTFASKAEARRWQELWMHQTIGNIDLLNRQIPIYLVVNGEKVCQIVWDFNYRKGGQMIVEDVKGAKGTTAYALYRVKAKLFMALFPEAVVMETRNGRSKQISRDRGGEDPPRAREGRAVRRPRKRPA